MCIGFWLECLKETDYLEKLGEDGNIILKYMLKETEWGGERGLDLYPKDREN